MTKVLVIEDDRTLRDMLELNLRSESYTPVVARDAPTGVMTARREDPDIILLDVMLPGGSGFDVCREIRTFSRAPVIMLSARGEEIDRVLGLEVGADDYVVKPFSLRELFARIKAHLRRVGLDQFAEESPTFSHGDIVVDTGSRKVTVAGNDVTMQPREFDLLAYFLGHQGVVLGRHRLLMGVWGHEYVGERTVDVHVRRVRAKLEAAGSRDIIRTVHGVGYACDPDIEVQR